MDTQVFYIKILKNEHVYKIGDENDFIRFLSLGFKHDIINEKIYNDLLDKAAVAHNPTRDKLYQYFNNRAQIINPYLYKEKARYEYDSGRSYYYNEEPFDPEHWFNRKIWKPKYRKNNNYHPVYRKDPIPGYHFCRPYRRPKYFHIVKARDKRLIIGEIFDTYRRPQKSWKVQSKRKHQWKGAEK